MAFPEPEPPALAMSAIVSNTDFADISAFASEVKKAFKTAIPPIVFSIDKRENVEQFVQQMQSDRGFLGKRVSCKHAKTSSFGNFSLNELYSFDEERYPIQLSFKQLKECEDFANGWIRLSEKIEREKVEAEEAARKKEEDERNRVEEERLQKERSQENLAKQDELTKELKATRDRLAMVAEKYLDGELTKEEKTQLTERYSIKIAQLQDQLKEYQSGIEEHESVSVEKRETQDTLDKPTMVQESSTSTRTVPSRKKVRKIIAGVLGGIVAVILGVQIIDSIQYSKHLRELEEARREQAIHFSNQTKKLHTGMTEDEVVSILGKPGSRDYDHWTHKTSMWYGGFKVVLYDGRVSSWQKVW